MKLPWDWLDWAAENGLTATDGDGYLFSGHGRLWRVTNNKSLEVSCPVADFDRWANSSAAEIDLPITARDFRRAVRRLLSAAEQEAAASNEPPQYVRHNHRRS